MDFRSLMFITISVALLALTLRARQMGIPPRDVAVLGALSGFSGLASLAISLS